MKKIYSIACGLLALYSFAQQTVSFEDYEGFTAGNIHGQGTWISTPTGGNPENVISQTITGDNATDGSNSLKIVKESLYGVQSEPIIGGFYNLPIPLECTHFSVSFDINMSQLDSSVFGFQGVDTINEQTIVRVDFDKTGTINVLHKDSNIQNMVSTTGIWSPNTWYRLKVVGTSYNIRYYLNNALIYTQAISNPLTMDQLRFVHDNGSGVAYFDHIKINSELILSAEDEKSASKSLILSPNPVTDFVRINSDEKIKNIKIFDTLGRKIKIELDGNVLDARKMPAGLYFVQITTAAKQVVEKIIKK